MTDLPTCHPLHWFNPETLSCDHPDHDHPVQYRVAAYDSRSGRQLYHRPVASEQAAAAYIERASKVGNGRNYIIEKRQLDPPTEWRRTVARS